MAREFTSSQKSISTGKLISQLHNSMYSAYFLSGFYQYVGYEAEEPRLIIAAMYERGRGDAFAERLNWIADTTHAEMTAETARIRRAGMRDAKIQLAKGTAAIDWALKAARLTLEDYDTMTGPCELHVWK